VRFTAAPAHTGAAVKRTIDTMGGA
jgi:hypothetical protein